MILKLLAIPLQIIFVYIILNALLSGWKFWDNTLGKSYDKDDPL